MFENYKPELAWHSDSCSLAGIEIHDLIRGHEETAKQILSNSTSVREATRDMLIDAQRWLPGAAEVYNISSKLNDYVMVPVIIMPTELPNRNTVAFSFKELSRYNPFIGRLAFETWKGKPTHQEHANADPLQAKGTIFDSMFKPMPKFHGDLWKVITLCGFDRSKDPVATNGILSGEYDSYSMGALVRDYVCNICSTPVSKGGCEHVVHGRPKFNLFNGTLAKLDAIDPIGIEVSIVKHPAYSSAQVHREKVMAMFAD